MNLPAQLRAQARYHGDYAAALPEGPERTGVYAYAAGLLDAADSIESGEVRLGTVRLAMRVLSEGGKR